jgi:phage terminase large subunit
MTVPKQFQLEQMIKRRGPYKTKDLYTFDSKMLEVIEQALLEQRGIKFPCTQFQKDIIGFCHKILGFRPYKKQRECLLAIQNNKKVAIGSGRRVGKTKLLCAAALWLFCCFPFARVMFTAPTMRQIRDTLWRDLRITVSESGICVDCKAEGRETRPCDHSAIIPGEPGETPHAGFRTADFREILGSTSNKGEGLQGFAGSGPMAVFADEASGVPEFLFIAFKGNAAANNMRVVLSGNPTKNTGEFARALFKGDRTPNEKRGRNDYWTTRISSEESPNVTGEFRCDGLAEREWIEDMAEEYGRDSPFFTVHVLGQNALNEAGKIFPFGLIVDAEKRWEDLFNGVDEPEYDKEPPLRIGIDPSGDTSEGDEFVFTVVRGLVCFEKVVLPGCGIDGCIAEVKQLQMRWEINDAEVTILNVDAEGKIGAEIYGGLRAHEQTPGARVKVFGVRSSAKTSRDAHTFVMTRDAMADNLRRWVKRGGCFPEDPKLRVELNTLTFKLETDNRARLMPKGEIKKEIGRSPDRYDSLALAVWQATDYRIEAGDQPGHATNGSNRDQNTTTSDRPHTYGAIDPYGSQAVDPFG